MDYQLPHLKNGCRLLFQGDSITDMNWGRNQADRNHYLGHSFVYLIAARLGMDMPEVGLDFYNRGISGNTTRDLRERWQSDAIDMNPDILTILIGTNDAGHNIEPSEYETNYRFILEASLNANPDVKLVLMNPFVLQCGKLAEPTAWEARRAAVDDLCKIVQLLAQKYGAIHIKLNDLFDQAAAKTAPSHWLWDGVHPLPQGHELIARHWIQAVTERNLYHA